MIDRLNLRTWYFGVFLACAGLLVYAYYLQHEMFLDPCPLCIFQRVAFAWIGIWALIAAIHNPSGRAGRWFYGVFVFLGAAVGAGIAGRHVQLQNLPADQVPECGPGLSYMMDTMPFMQVLDSVITGSGSCAEVQWNFLGLSMPGWTLVWYLGLGLLSLFLVFTTTRKAGLAT
ncbi:MAG: disulfide bond formation protein B [Pseudomonadota bacterium]